MGLVYDPLIHSSFLFGGYTNPTFLNDTWTWNSQQGWTELSPATSPSPRLRLGMAYDGAAESIVLFGGSDSSDTVLNDTWIWDGANWTQQSPVVSPPGRIFGAMAYDKATKTVVLFGGYDTNFNPLNDTWLWDGIPKTWTQQFPVSSPSPRQAAMAYDDATGTVVLFAGTNYPDCCWNTGNAVPQQTQVYDDTWTWDGANWTQQFPASSPSARSGNTLAYDRALGSVVLFGG